MEPLTSTAMIGALVGYLAKKLKDNQSVNDFLANFTSATVHWIRPLFLKPDNQYEKIIEDLVKNPDSAIKQDMVKTAIASHLEDTPADAQQLKAMYEELLAQVGPGAITNTATITGNDNKVYQGISGSTINDHSVTQTHSGSGDNVAGDKKVYNIDKIDKADFS